MLRRHMCFDGVKVWSLKCDIQVMTCHDERILVCAPGRYFGARKVRESREYIRNSDVRRFSHLLNRFSIFLDSNLNPNKVAQESL